MPQTVISDMHVKGTNPFSPKRSENDGQKNPVEITFDQGATAGETSTLAEVNCVGKPQLKLPDLTLKTKRVSTKKKNELQALLRVRRFDLSLQIHGLKPEWNTSSDKLTSAPSGSQSSKTSTEQYEKGTSKDSFKDKTNIFPPLSFSTVLKGQHVNLRDCQSSKTYTVQDDKVVSESEQSNDKAESFKDKNNNSLLPSFSTVLKGQRVNLRVKERLDKQQKQQGKKGNTFSYQTDSEYEESFNEFEMTKTSKLKMKHQTRSNVVSLKPGKHDTQPVFHLPKADKYDITPGGKHTGGKVLKLNDLKTSSIYSGYKDSWVPRPDKYLMKCSVFETIMQQPTVFLRQPSPVAGVKMTLQQQEYLAAAIHAVEETNVPHPPIVAELTQQVNTFVVRLPLIC